MYDQIYYDGVCVHVINGCDFVHAYNMFVDRRFGSVGL